MIHINGDIHHFLCAVGKKSPSSDILNALTLSSDHFFIEKINDFEMREYWHFFDNGVVFDFNNDDVLENVFFYMKKHNQYRIYDSLENLITGFYYGIDKGSIVKICGNPDCYKNRWIKYFIENKYIHFEFDNYEELSMITLGLNE